ncbi:hypothetical protein [Sphingomonas sp. 22176]|uniref:hypothetical protein n=1 Tax=Sphingomonas sp. 22176 TaxID=3453884 RepID=UPI003F841AD5
MSVNDDDFLGRGWVPLTLLAVASSMAGLVLVGWVGAAFLTAGALVALSITARLTWDKRRHRLYMPVMAGLIAVHLVAIITFGPHTQRGPGALFMLGAVADATIITAVLRLAL